MGVVEFVVGAAVVAAVGLAVRAYARIEPVVPDPFDYPAWAVNDDQ